MWKFGKHILYSVSTTCFVNWLKDYLNSVLDVFNFIVFQSHVLKTFSGMFLDFRDSQIFIYLYTF